MMENFTIGDAIKSLGFEFGWAANESDGILHWERDEPQPTEAELIAAGWAKPEPQEETPTE